MVIDWLAAGLDPDKATHLHPEPPARARRAVHAAGDGHAARLARAHADLQGPDREAEGPRPRDLRLPRLPAAAGGRHPDLQGRVRAGRRGPGARTSRSRARWRAASTTCTAASRTSTSCVEAALKKLGKDDARRRSRRARKAYRREAATALRSSAAARSSPRAASLGGDDRERLDGHLRGTGKTILAEPRRAAHRDARSCAGLDGAKMSKSYGNAIAMREEPAEVERKIRRMHDRPGARAPHRPGRPREVPGVAASTRSTRRGDAGLGRQGLHHRGDRLPRLQAAGDRGDHPRAGAVARARRAATSRTRSGCTGSSRSAPSGRARWPSETMRDVRDAMGLSY